QRRPHLRYRRAGARARTCEGRRSGARGGGDGQHIESGGWMTSPRRRAREFALQGIYQWQYTGEGASQVLKNLSELEKFDAADRAFLEEQLRGTIAEAGGLRARLEPLVDRKWE